MLPKTIDCTFTARAEQAADVFHLAVLTARGCIQLLNTASIARFELLERVLREGLAVVLLRRPSCTPRTASIMPSSGTSVSSLALYFVLDLVEGHFEVLVIDARNDVAEHVDQAAVASRRRTARSASRWPDRPRLRR